MSFIARKAHTLPNLPIFKALASHTPTSTAIIHAGKHQNYANLINDVAKTKGLLGVSKGTRVGLMSESTYDYVVSMLAVWAAGGIFVPLCTGHPKPEIDHVIKNSGCDLVLSQDSLLDRVYNHGAKSLRQFIKPEEADPEKDKIEFDDQVKLEDSAMILYTSGTTSQPKGVLSKHKTITSQSTSLLEAWEYSSSDVLLHTLPLHHIHGIVNALVTPLLAGSTVEFQNGFNASKVWNRLVAGHVDGEKQITMFMGVPTMYKALANHFETLPVGIRPSTAESASALRLAVSGSAALPVRLADSWTSITGTPLLERYGMTEIGMALSCGLPVETRLSGSVGWPLPGVGVRLVDDEGDPVDGTGREGELQIKGDSVFTEYWNKPEITASEFQGEWFKTGDVATRGSEGEYYIKGRKSVDIIKVGGEKVSALEVERDILEMPNISEVAICALPSNYWGQIIGAVIVLSPGVPTEWFKKSKARRELKKRIAIQKIPRVWRVVESIPRNTMGKVNKKTLITQVFGDYQRGEEEADED